ncbi:putative glycolipid-binding domain-containing protein [Streptomyces sp. HNM0575]|uniref:putative glycolipid-binding domain-containing protein n=1 Tax=Streptomyces sp. HNM0575 TaxID=2716338 RepID=UPI00145CA080|nr:putative glycolipid-binding domain-containing protein [Streptomyces sp. HNM0575]NLU72740.1 putative glycolipid-binding domain-containing protein [Streptomyces sp. HNM0575]
MDFRDPPKTAAWQHVKTRAGFEAVYFQPAGDGLRIHGCTTAVEDGRTWIVDYELELDAAWATRTAHISGRSADGHRERSIVADGAGHWQIDGRVAPDLDGCRDIDLESSAMTNAFPVRRLRLAEGDGAQAPAAYVRAADLAVERLDQTYELVSAKSGRHRYEYAAPALDFGCRLTYDGAGLVREYPGIAIRVT